MKMVVITDDRGAVVGTARVTEPGASDLPFGGRPSGEKGRQVHDVTLPRELHEIGSARELHRELARLIYKGSGESPRSS